MDSTKLLTEKLALARELSNLRPELDHLQSQVASNRSLLAEKLSLEHQVTTLQLELETEKRSMQRILVRDGKARAEDAKLESQLQAIQAELNRERRERTKVERESQEASHVCEAQKTTLESRQDSFRSKLQATKDSLKEAQQELHNARSTTASKGHERTDSKTAATNARKRTATQMLSDSMIGTPGDMTDDRRTKRMSTLPGDKSTFSITPYLNRTASVAPESPTESAVQSLDAPATVGASSTVQNAAKTATKVLPAILLEKSRNVDPRTTDPSKNGKGTAKVAPGRNKLKPALLLEQVVEEEADEHQHGLNNPSRPVGPTADDDTTIGGDEATKKKKRKLFRGGLSKTLFDEDDHEPGKPGPGARAFGSLNKGSFVGSKSRPLRTAPAAASIGFGAFSPLKRNRQISAARG